MDEFKPGDRVEVVTSSAGHTAGQQGTVLRLEPGVILVELDKQTELPDAVTIVDLSSNEVGIFQADELRRVVTPSA
jgi:hypothetical protein